MKYKTRRANALISAQILFFLSFSNSFCWISEKKVRKSVNFIWMRNINWPLTATNECARPFLNVMSFTIDNSEAVGDRRQATISWWEQDRRYRWASMVDHVWNNSNSIKCCQKYKKKIKMRYFYSHCHLENHAKRTKHFTFYRSIKYI